MDAFGCELLGLDGFRNYHNLEITPPPGGCLLVGPNGSGKSNLLEAIQLLSAGRGVNPSGGLELIRVDDQGERAGFARVRGRVGAQERRPAVLEMVIAPLGSGRVSRRAWIGGQMRPRRELLGRLPLVQFDPRDIELVSGQPATRRRFANWAIGQAEPEYVAALADYERARRQRNALLRELAIKPGADVGQLDYWDGLLVEHGEKLIAARESWLTQVGNHAREIYSDLTRVPGDLALIYRPAVSGSEPGALAEAFRHMRQRELAVGATLAGPHRDDFQIRLGGHAASSYGSRGQQRLAVLCIKLGLLRWLSEKLGATPVLALDDIFSELDPEHRLLLSRQLPVDAQLFLASADPDQVPADLADRCQVYEVSDGNARPV